MPPLMTVGFIFAAFKIEEIREVVVVFPWDPETAIEFFSFTIWDSISALVIDGILFFFANVNSTLLFFTAVEYIIKLTFFKFSCLCPLKVLIFFFV